MILVSINQHYTERQLSNASPHSLFRRKSPSKQDFKSRINSITNYKETEILEDEYKSQEAKQNLDDVTGKL